MKLKLRPNALRLGGHGVAWGLLAAVLLLLVPRFESIFFVDLGIPLPSSARIVIAIAHLAFRLAPIVPMLLAAWLVADCYVLKAFGARGETRLARAWSLLMLMIPLALIVLIACSLGVVFFTLDPRLSG